MSFDIFSPEVQDSSQTFWNNFVENNLNGKSQVDEGQVVTQPVVTSAGQPVDGKMTALYVGAIFVIGIVLLSRGKK